MATVTAGQIQAQVSAIRKRVKNGAQIYALRTSEGWSGPDRLHIDGTEHLIMPCLSDLQAREALLRASAEDKPVVLLCTVSPDKLGEDVITRFAKQRVFMPQIRDVLAELFSARIVDPRVLTTKPLFEALLERSPASGYAPVPGGSLDLQQAWTALMEQVVGVRIEGPSLGQVLEWSLDARKVKALSELNGPLKEAFVDWFARTRGEAVRFAMGALDAGLGADLIPLGLSLGLVFSPELQKEPDFHAARARLEKFFGGKAIDPDSARTWFRAAEGAIQPLTEQAGASVLRNLLNRLDQLLGDLKLLDFAHLSDYSPTGLSARFDMLGISLQKALKAKTGGDTEGAQSSLLHIGHHILASVESDRSGRAEMAIRLIRWLQSPKTPEAAASLPNLAEFYTREGGFLDWARYRLRETDVSSNLQSAYRQLLAQVDARMSPFENDFAVRLADWTKNAAESDRLVCIEDVLAKVVIPVAKEQPMLLLVLDGMSVAVFRQLIGDVERQNWSEIALEQLGLPCPVLATLPSVTQISRRALFLGKLDCQLAGTEKGEFAGNDLLFQASGSQVRPQLFLKGDLQDASHGGLSETVRTAISDKKCRVVGVVVNAVDDHLDSGDQVVFTWGLDRIKPLRELLKYASDSGRVVVMTSDHGHVLDFGTRQLPAESENVGDRYRASTAAPKEGELIFEGPRIKRATGQERITLACDTAVRYGPKKRGYHGGANPQEMIAPLAILATGNSILPPGWSELAPFEPDWWRGAQADRIERGTATTAKPEVKVPEELKGLELFEQVTSKPTVPSKGWIQALLASETYQLQAKLGVRGGVPSELMVTFLQTLENRGGSVMKASLAQALGIPLFRIDGLVQNISRILNVDGYEVLGFDRASETITLNISLLKTQFELG